MRSPKIGTSDNETFFQQKWRAKGMLRAYHGEHVVERKWERMFSRRLLGVADMDPAYMARNDGSELAAGRGSGRDEPPRWDEETIRRRTLTPYMQMAFAPMERRLDIAVFRAMFASSARQARQLCVHGKVKVNGKVMPYPAYRLNPGDMFQVDPDMVMLATGRKKDPKNLGPERFKKNKARKGALGEETEEAASEQEAEAEAAAGESEEQAAEAQQRDPDTTDVPEPEKADLAPRRRQIQDLVKYAKEVIAEPDLSAAQKQKLRAFMRRAKPLLARAGRANAEPSDIADELSRMVGDLKLSSSSSSSEPSSPTQETHQQSQQQQNREAATTNTSIEDLTGDERRALERLIREEEENPHDPSKPYLTPWRPRDYMSPFAFIPRYLEGNQNVCAAVYLRHPGARVGNAEVPTPYPYEINQLAYNWYLRRR
ncbi:hypothetical protein DL762_005064 [Monosporascus cannonballus]|uniref:RNA-binding S4 domain-containing protein n=1 Tax=Monosporascus cannonballus TaxID=155416 RepID=A0ABY0H924_9PEZI|nr:hypothetical protein DL762_005064 [Monosporascus cannonballus]